MAAHSSRGSVSCPDTIERPARSIHHPRPSSQLLQVVLVLSTRTSSLVFTPCFHRGRYPIFVRLLEGSCQRIARHKTWRTKRGVGRQLEGAATTEHAQESCCGPTRKNDSQGASAFIRESHERYKGKERRTCIALLKS